MARWLSWLERRPVTAEVDGSNPFRVVIAKNHFSRSGFFVSIHNEYRSQSVRYRVGSFCETLFETF